MEQVFSRNLVGHLIGSDQECNWKKRLGFLASTQPARSAIALLITVQIPNHPELVLADLARAACGRSFVAT